MSRLTSDKDVQDMGMVELAYNSCYAKDGKARYRDYDIDIDARQFAIELLEGYADIPNEFTCDDDFDEAMIGYMSYGIENIEGLIALFYRNLWAMADLRERLKRYEDTRLTPEQVLEMDEMYQELSKEVMEYRKVGTLEELRELEAGELSGPELAQIAIVVRKLREYDAIGTVEECREAVERQKAKKPLRIDMCTCPTCGTYNESVKKRRNTVNQDIVYCWHCGQAMEINRSDVSD